MLGRGESLPKLLLWRGSRREGGVSRVARSFPVRVPTSKNFGLAILIRNDSTIISTRNCPKCLFVEAAEAAVLLLVPTEEVRKLLFF